MYTVTNVTLIGLGLAVVGTVTVQAQSASIQATAAVQSPITVTALNPLDFQLVFPGVPKGVALNSATAGRFTATGQGGAPVSMTVAVPANLTDASANTLQIGSWQGSWNVIPNSAGTGFTPGAGSFAGTFSVGGQLWVYVGATVTPLVTQVAGNYAGTVQLTVTY
jgi:uncharacterized protein DUF4402